MTDIISDVRLDTIRVLLHAFSIGSLADSGAMTTSDILSLLARLDKAEALMLDLRAYIVTHDDISMHSNAVALSDRVTNHFPPSPSSGG